MERMQEFLTLNALVLFGSVIALAGGIACLKIKPLARFLNQYASSFAAGVLLTIALIGLLPEAVHELGSTAFTLFVLSFLGTYVFESFFFDLHHHHEDDHHPHHTSALPLIIFGDTIHNFIDGAAIAATFLASPALGITTAVSTFLHEVPHEMSDFGVLMQAQWSEKKIILTNILSALAAFAGAYAVYFFANTMEILGYLLAVSGGIFLYLGASDFLPKPGKVDAVKKSVWVCLAGAAVIFATVTLIPHTHAETDHTQEAHSHQTGDIHTHDAHDEQGKHDDHEDHESLHKHETHEEDYGHKHHVHDTHEG